MGIFLANVYYAAWQAADEGDVRAITQVVAEGAARTLSMYEQVLQLGQFPANNP